MTGLLERWLPLGLPVGVGRDLLARWSEPHRRYHDTRHLAEVLDAVDMLGGNDVVRLAAWWHDAVYVPGADDNEARSATLARAVAGERVAELVLVTVAHEAAGDTEAAVLCDADLAILGAAPERYDAYAADVRSEYSHVLSDDFRAGRSAVLSDLIARPRLYATATGAARWDVAARGNMRRELARLG